MKDYLDLAIRYGGFTNLDKVYLKRRLKDLTPRQKLDFITPPPSVINAYFAEIYQKQSPKTATEYFRTLSTELEMLVEYPSFAEEHPFIRLNLSGKSYGFSYVNAQGLAMVFSQYEEEVTPSVLFELARIFPHYHIWEENGNIMMEEKTFSTESLVEEELAHLLTRLARNDEIIKIWGPNQEEVIEVAEHYQGKVYYAWLDRMATIYLVQ